MLQILTSPVNGNGTGFGQTPEEPGRVTPIVTTVATSPSIPEGTSNTDTATVTGDSASGSPTGTVSFYECGPTPTAEPCTSQANPVGGQQKRDGQRGRHRDGYIAIVHPDRHGLLVLRRLLLR